MTNDSLYLILPLIEGNYLSFFTPFILPLQVGYKGFKAVRSIIIMINFLTATKYRHFTRVDLKLQNNSVRGIVISFHWGSESSSNSLGISQTSNTFSLNQSLNFFHYAPQLYTLLEGRD